MTTAERAAGIIEAIKTSGCVGNITCDDLLGLVTAELGHVGILDSPQIHGDLECLAIAPKCILHIIAGNTPMAGIQSIIRGLLLGSHNLVKLPSIELPEIIRFVEALPQNLKNLVELKSELPNEWMHRCNALIVFGGDDTIRTFRQRSRADQIFIAHGHRISFAIVFQNDNKTAAKLAARDISLYDQQGCLSPHDLYVQTDNKSDALEFADQLAVELERFNQHTPRRKLSAEENAQITALRDSYDFRQSNDPRVKLWSSPNSTDWTVIYEDDPLFAVSPLNRVAFVKPLPDLDLLPKSLFLVHSHLSSIAIHPFNQKQLQGLLKLGANRICPLGKSQAPSLFWHQDGAPQLSPLVHWIDIG
ncbi:MAG: hypothetical protein GXP30_07375 [Verrucomicrobia bacterium]|nr:hypothetical protein [Verrucomicrobiota bacterium]